MMGFAMTGAQVSTEDMEDVDLYLHTFFGKKCSFSVRFFKHKAITAYAFCLFYKVLGKLIFSYVVHYLLACFVVAYIGNNMGIAAKVIYCSGNIYRTAAYICRFRCYKSVLSSFGKRLYIKISVCHKTA